MLSDPLQGIRLSESLVTQPTNEGQCCRGRTALAIIFSDAACFTVALCVALILCPLLGYPLHQHIVLDGVTVIVATLCTIAAASFYPALGTDVVLESRRLVECVAFVHVCNICSLFIVHANGYQPFALTFFALAVILSPFGRSLVRIFLSRTRWWGEPVLLIGAGQPLYDVVKLLQQSPRLGLRPAKILDEADWSECISDIPVFHRLDTVLQLDQQPKIQTVIVVRGPSGELPFADAHRVYSASFSKVIFVSPEISRLLRFSSETIFGGELSQQISQALLLETDLRLKRTLDLLLASCLITFLSPILLLIAIAVKLTSPGLVFFRHQRIGKNGVPFHVWKFRTMVRDADVRLAERLANSEDAREEWQRDQKLRNDPRITPIGGFLRRFSLDEFPQIWNVLRGEMSMVGPRPICYEEISRYGEDFTAYSKVRPGITGLWQVSGRNEMSYANRVGIDAYYVKHWSPWMDLYILVRTFNAVSSSRGAY
jgi:Undecaprenyl-phosphate galactose phosphotransferase WbaP